MIDVSNFVKTLGGKPAAVFGLGRSNLATIAALIAAGCQVTAWDDHEAPRDAAKTLGAQIADLTRLDLTDYACLVLAPGVPLHFPAPHPVAANAQRAGIEIICDIEILYRSRLGRRIIAVTGTNGKSTTTALIGHVLNACGIPAAVGGNIGHAALGLDLPSPDGVFVLEVSSYQLDLCPTFAPDIAVLLNITPDHLERHGSMAAYIKTKARLLRGVGTGVVAIDDAETRAIYDDIRAAGYRTLTPVSTQAALSPPGVAATDGKLAGFNLEELPTLRGVHNHQNAAAAFAAARLAGLAPDAIFAAMKTFPGLAHRQFPVGQIAGVTYIDDSKATNADAAAKALATYSDIYWIAGGRAKDGGLQGLENFLPSVRCAYLIGEAAEEFGAWLEAHGVEAVLCGTLDVAVETASAEASPGSTVLLSPAAASLDQFRNFEERGEMFAALVWRLKG